MKKDTLIIMPAYNEEASIGNFLDQLLTSDAMHYADVLVINDSSSDKTGEILREYEQKYPQKTQPVHDDEFVPIDSDFTEKAGRKIKT